jgi:hypothetical protein
MALSDRHEVAAAGVRVELSRALLWRVTLAVAAVDLLLLLGTSLFWTIPWAWRARNWVVEFLVIESNLDIENNVATWVSSATLLLVAVAAVICAAAVLQRLGREARPAAAGWIGKAFLFALLSFDELGSMHERLSWLWLAAPMLIYGVGLAALALHIKRNSTAAFWVASLGFLLYVSVPVQEELSAVLRSAAGWDEWVRPAWHTVLEEGAELYATLCFFVAFGLYALALGRDPTIPGRSQTASVWLPRRHVRTGILVAFAVLAAGTAFFEFLAPESFTRAEILSLPWAIRGIPVNWFGAASALLAALVGIQAWRTELGAPAGARRLNGAWILLATSVCCLLLSAAHGADLFFSNMLQPGSPRVQYAIRVAAVLTVASLGALLFFRERGLEGAARIGFLVWPALLGIALLANPIGASVLLVIGYGSLVLSLLPLLWSRTGPPNAGSLGSQLPTSSDD